MQKFDCGLSKKYLCAVQYGTSMFQKNPVDLGCYDRKKLFGHSLNRKISHLLRSHFSPPHGHTNFRTISHVTISVYGHLSMQML